MHNAVLCIIFIQFISMFFTGNNTDREYIKLMFGGENLNYKKKFDKYLSERHIIRMTKCI